MTQSNTAPEVGDGKGDIRALYAKIPKVVGCRTGCNDCCDPIHRSANCGAMPRLCNAK